MDRPHHRGVRHRHRSTGKGPARDAVPTMRSGLTDVLCFGSDEHLITTPRGTATRERQDIGYRDMSSPQGSAPAKAPQPPPAAKHRESHMADPVLLFRYSALPF